MEHDEKLEALYSDRAEWTETLSEMRRRISDPNEIPDGEEVLFHQDVLVKMQTTAWETEREIYRLEWEKKQYDDSS